MEFQGFQAISPTLFVHPVSSFKKDITAVVVEISTITAVFTNMFCPITLFLSYSPKNKTAISTETPADIAVEINIFPLQTQIALEFKEKFLQLYINNIRLLIILIIYESHKAFVKCKHYKSTNQYNYSNCTIRLNKGKSLKEIIQWSISKTCKENYKRPNT